jgi:hypothetical protein
MIQTLHELHLRVCGGQIDTGVSGTTGILNIGKYEYNVSETVLAVDSLVETPHTERR